MICNLTNRFISGFRCLGVTFSFVRQPELAIAGFALLCLALLAYAHLDLTGPDYGYFLPKLLDSHIFYLNNGLAIQEYTAGLCAGVFRFANPQSMALALPQALSSLFGPQFGIPATFVVSSALAGVGTYLCARFWGLGRMPACIAAIAIAFNGFLLTRMAIGHLAYYAFGFVPMLAAALLYGIGALRQGRVQAAMAYGCLAALLLAVLIYGGVGVMVLHTMGAVALMLLVCGGFDRDWLKASLFCLACLLVGLLAAAPKVEAVLAMNANLQRDFYPLGGFDLVGLLPALFEGLFWIPSVGFLNEHLQNKAVGLGWHEFYYGFTPLLLVVLVASLAFGWKRLSFGALKERPVVLGLVGFGLLLAMAVNFYEPHWNALLKSLPIVGQIIVVARFFVVFIPVVALFIGWALSHWKQIPLAAALALIGALALFQHLVIEANLRPDMNYGKTPGLEAILAAWPSERDQFPPISEVSVVTRQKADGRQVAVAVHSDDYLLLQGKSNGSCYVSLFGYRLEQYQLKSLRTGAIDAADADGNLNLKNPACYVYPQENSCEPGDHFKLEQREAMLALANHTDPGLAVSSARKTANLVGIMTLLLLGGFLGFYMALSAWRSLGAVAIHSEAGK